jgi:hypothetical protein
MADPRLPLEAPVTMATLPSSTLYPFPLPRLVDAVRVTPGRDMIRCRDRYWTLLCDWMQGTLLCTLAWYTIGILSTLSCQLRVGGVKYQAVTNVGSSVCPFNRTG